MLSPCTQTWSAEFVWAIFIAAAYGETAPNEKQHSKTPISQFCKAESPKETFAKHGVSFSTGLVETLKLGSATAINTCSLKHPKTGSVFAVTPSAGGPSTDMIFGIADNSQLQEHRVVSCTECDPHAVGARVHLRAHPVFSGPYHAATSALLYFSPCSALIPPSSNALLCCGSPTNTTCLFPPTWHPPYSALRSDTALGSPGLGMRSPAGSCLFIPLNTQGRTRSQVWFSSAWLAPGKPAGNRDVVMQMDSKWAANIKVLHWLQSITEAVDSWTQTVRHNLKHWTASWKF